MNPRDREIIRKLGAIHAEIAALPVQEEKRNLWKRLNGLQPTRPLVAIDQLPWHELDFEGELTLRVEDPFLRRIEESLRRTLYQWKHFPGDMVVEPYLELSIPIFGTDFGMAADDDRAALDGANDIVGHSYHNQIRTEEDIQKIEMPQVRIDEAEARRMEDAASEILSGILPVKMTGATGFFALWDRLAEWISPEGLLYDLADRPEFIHALMERYTMVNLAYVDQMEALGLFEPAQTKVHCSYAYTDELPAVGFDPGRPRAKDSWAFGMAQIFATVSPAMHEEFEIDYVKRIYERFGQVYYGCCEPLHDRIDLIRKLPNVRKISCSPWCNISIASEAIGRDYVISRKPSPVWLASKSPDWVSVEKEMRNTIAVCRHNHSPVEFILKDVSTVQYRPDNLWKWENLAMEIANEA